MTRTQRTRSVAVVSGNPFPLGAHVAPGGTNFSIYSKRAERLELLLFADADARTPEQVIPLDARRHRTFHYWHAFVPGVRAGQVYGYRAHGPNRPEDGLRFDGAKVLLDPYGRALAMPRGYDRTAAAGAGDNAATAPRSVVVDPTRYDWADDAPLRRPFARTVIYEMHVRGFTRHPSSGVADELRGTYLGVIEKIPYLVDLGITAVELLPVFAFDPYDAPAGHDNYWGYSPLGFFAPHPGYATSRDPLKVLDEFRDMVKALHRAGIEVILDVVFNHTAEGDERGPTLCFRGLENRTYYMLAQDRSRYVDYSGTGNTLNASHAVVRRLIVDSLRYWVEHMHVDGFRFDLASILTRDADGRPLARPPVLFDIETDPVLAGVKLIAEAWDAAGLYQVGTFFGDNWKEWNGRFRDDVRGFLRGDRDTARHLAPRLLGSPDLYEHEGREAEQSINFVTCHDGFTLNDLVSYEHKHNEANGEANRDGADDNRSWNCGVEGPSDDPGVNALRNRQVKNFLALTLFAIGAPMLTMGDEVRRTQRGNNNAYCQDNEISWFDWELLERHPDVLRFVRELIRMRLAGEAAATTAELNLAQRLRQHQVRWHGVELDRPDWGPDSHTVSFTAQSLGGDALYHFVVNAWQEPLEFRLPLRADRSPHPWRRLVDTAAASPGDARRPSEAPVEAIASVRVAPHSLVMLWAEVRT
ncbi:MAG: glycogen debranching protein GlgX [Planctomycetes bacterium]|nr:glycogen debranching protein GlgX [Planctomycetota bacterium]